MKAAEYARLRARIMAMGYGADIDWAESVGPPGDADDFALEIVFVICNSGMKATIARPIYERVKGALFTGLAAATVFGHAGKAQAIDTIWRERLKLYDEFSALDYADRLDWLGRLPWIGPITKFHCARNFGVDCVKPDRHLQRIADAAGTTPHDLCAALAQASGDRIGTVDYVLWRAAERGLIKTASLGDGQGLLL